EAGRVGQLTTALVLVQLARDDAVSAAKSLQKSFKCEDFEISEDAKICSALISAFESGDNNSFQQVLQRPILRGMDNEYLRLMKELKASSELSGRNGNDNDAREEGGDGSDEDLK
ncbi:unnamed protein product, partial [Onchocerca flexuosa]